MGYVKVIDDILDSDNTTVGGGSASAIAGALGASLISMSTKLSMGKDYGLSDEEYTKLSDELDNLSKDLLKGSEDDTKAYLLIRDAFRMPRSTEKEKEERKKAISNAGIEAALVPKSNADKCIRVLEISEYLEGKYNDSTFSDFVIGKNLAFLGIQGCIFNIEANLSLIKDEQIKADLEKFIEDNKADE